MMTPVSLSTDTPKIEKGVKHLLQREIDVANLHKSFFSAVESETSLVDRTDLYIEEIKILMDTPCEDLGNHDEKTDLMFFCWSQAYIRSGLIQKAIESVQMASELVKFQIREKIIEKIQEVENFDEVIRILNTISEPKERDFCIRETFRPKDVKNRYTPDQIKKLLSMICKPKKRDKFIFKWHKYYCEKGQYQDAVDLSTLFNDSLEGEKVTQMMLTLRLLFSRIEKECVGEKVDEKIQIFWEEVLKLKNQDNDLFYKGVLKAFEVVTIPSDVLGVLLCFKRIKGVDETFYIPLFSYLLSNNYTRQLSEKGFKEIFKNLSARAIYEVAKQMKSACDHIVAYKNLERFILYFQDRNALKEAGDLLRKAGPLPRKDTLISAQISIGGNPFEYIPMMCDRIFKHREIDILYEKALQKRNLKDLEDCQYLFDDTDPQISVFKIRFVFDKLVFAKDLNNWAEIDQFISEFSLYSFHKKKEIYEQMKGYCGSYNSRYFEVISFLYEYPPFKMNIFFPFLCYLKSFQLQGSVIAILRFHLNQMPRALLKEFNEYQAT